MKKWMVFISLWVIASVLMACTSESGVSPSDKKNTPPDIEETMTLGSKDNPVGRGVTVSIKTNDFFYGHVHYEMTLCEVISGEEAEEIVLKASPHNEPSGAELEYILAKFHMTLKEVENEPFFVNAYTFHVVNEDGISYELYNNIIGLIPAWPDNVNSGEEIEGWAGFLVRKDDKRPLVQYDRLWFDLRDER
ncbi:hypothetical protein SAMN05192534_103129 [Alteribacillus persepolensis]|uniref:DUF4352 domain-containing protein n=1 Tax=Alteribacillus persepolensis TaxID=568899 RepID=A0A1G8B2T0_9BACI|nr:hypothetical protein [Alteribacillus persepolensis]SDH27549.1 hypothetical protein SAMN05192534_103129 [Alteribacillus persepolensis]